MLNVLLCGHFAKKDSLRSFFYKTVFFGSSDLSGGTDFAERNPPLPRAAPDPASLKMYQGDFLEDNLLASLESIVMWGLNPKQIASAEEEFPTSL